MQWRRMMLSFVIVLGATLWALPFSVSAADFCVADLSPTGTTCPGSSTPVSPSACKKPDGSPLQCLSVVGGMYYEHCCQSAIDPCNLGSSVPSGTACSLTQARVNGCSAAGGSVCLDKTSFTAPTIPSVPICNGGCQTASCSATATPPTEIDTAGMPACLSTPATPNCCKPTVATCVTNPAAPGCPAATPPPVDCVATPTLPGCASTTVRNPLEFSTVEDVLTSLLGVLRGIIVVLSLIFIVIGAILYITSAGDDGRMKTAKGSITAAVIGLALGIAAPSFLRQIGDILGWGVPAGPVASAKTLSEIALSTLQFLLSVVGVLGIIMLVIGGIIYLTSAGDEDRAETGKKTVTYAIIGIAIALASLMAVTQIAKLFV